MAIRDSYTRTIADGDQLNDGYYNALVSSGGQELGEVRMFALTIAGAVTKSDLQARGWAICDGTTPAAQGISGADITAATPNLEDKFIRMSNDETSGTTGGADTHSHTAYIGRSGSDKIGINPNGDSFTSTRELTVSGAGDVSTYAASVSQTGVGTTTVSNIPAYYELVFFIKVKLI